MSLPQVVQVEGNAAHGAAQPPGAAGLVPFKTSGTLDISLAPQLVLERRIKRMRKSVWASGHLHQFAKSGRERVWFVTLTYRGVDDWEPRHISECLRRVRQWCKSRGVTLRYTWVAELQKRGALHYHVVVWLPSRLALPKFDKQGWWPHGMTQTAIAKNPIGYLMKYVSKISPFHQFPKGVRIYGIGGLERSGKDIRAWLNLPSWIKQSYGVGELVSRAGRRVVRDTGEILQALYRVVLIPSGLRLHANGPIPSRWADGPYSSVSFAQ